MITCINNEEEIKGIASKKKDRNSGILTKAKNMCSAFDKEYDEQNKARLQELHLITALKGLLEEKLMNKQPDTTHSMEIGETSPEHKRYDYKEMTEAEKLAIYGQKKKAR